MISEFAKVMQSVVDLEKGLREPVTVYLIGGGALMYRGLKGMTKDMDLVVTPQSEYDRMIGAMNEVGFKPQLPEDDYGRLELSQIMIAERSASISF